MKIGIVFDDSVDRPDGVQQHVKLIGRYFMSQGHEVHFLVGQSDESKNPDLNIHSLAKNISVKANQNRLTIPLPANKKRIHELLKRENYDVLNVQMPYSPFMSGRVIKAAPPSVAIVGTFHILGASRLEVLGSKALGAIQSATLKRFNRFVSVSKAAKKYSKAHFGIDSVVIPNPVDTGAFIGARPFARLKKTQNIVYINRLVERKGCGHLIDAVHHLDNHGLFKDRKLIVCGKGPLKSKLENKVRQFGLSNKVEFAGFISEADKPRYLASADLACYPSTGGESFGIVLIEAMAAGALTLGGNNPGYSTVLEDQPDLLVDPTDTATFARRIDELLVNKALRNKLISWQDEAVQQYDVKAVGKSFLNLYHEINEK
ncbi:MAG: glycosyltransferase family 4 protein [Candidatus Saccharimonadales bacterium]|nr:glycosyltransferase family 4 protein [Candidatus Saccharimonadales bacterium]